jgi:hypothetical protein
MPTPPNHSKPEDRNMTLKIVVALFAALAMAAQPALAETKKPKCPDGMVYKPSTNKCVTPSGSF